MELSVRYVKRDKNERLVLYVEETCNLWPFIIFDTTKNENGEISNIHRHSYIFPNCNVNSGDYIMLYTGQGKNSFFRNKANSTTYIFYWGFDENIHVWNENNDEVLIVKVDEYQKKKV